MPRDYGRIDDIVDAHTGIGLRSIFLRPVSFHGFAAKQSWIQSMLKHGGPTEVGEPQAIRSGSA
jgi:hypothetical protein